MMPPSPSPSQVIRDLRALAAKTLGPIDEWRRTVDPASFSDSRGNRLEIDAPLLAHVLRLEPPAVLSPSPDIALWHALWARADAPLDMLVPGPAAPLIRHREGTTIEVWTEAELIALHALWHLAARRDDATLRDRCVQTALWHAESTQPDNATGHPWATHVFLKAGAETGDWRLNNYAATLIHNCQIAGGLPDRRSAVILLDAADALEIV